MYMERELERRDGGERDRLGLGADLLFSSLMFCCVLISADKNFLKLF